MCIAKGHFNMCVHVIDMEYETSGVQYICLIFDHITYLPICSAYCNGRNPKEVDLNKRAVGCFWDLTGLEQTGLV